MRGVTKASSSSSSSVVRRSRRRAVPNRKYSDAILPLALESSLRGGKRKREDVEDDDGDGDDEEWVVGREVVKKRRRRGVGGEGLGRRGKGGEEGGGRRRGRRGGLGGKKVGGKRRRGGIGLSGSVRKGVVEKEGKVEVTDEIVGGVEDIVDDIVAKAVTEAENTKGDDEEKVDGDLEEDGNMKEDDNLKEDDNVKEDDNLKQDGDLKEDGNEEEDDDAKEDGNAGEDVNLEEPSIATEGSDEDYVVKKRKVVKKPRRKRSTVKVEKSDQEKIEVAKESERVGRRGSYRKRPPAFGKDTLIKEHAKELQVVKRTSPVEYMVVLQILKSHYNRLEQAVPLLAGVLLPKYTKCFWTLEKLMRGNVPSGSYNVGANGDNATNETGKVNDGGNETEEKKLLSVWAWRFGREGGVENFVKTVWEKFEDESKRMEWLQVMGECARKKVGIRKAFRRSGRLLGKDEREDLKMILKYEHSLGEKAGEGWPVVEGQEKTKAMQPTKVELDETEKLETGEEIPVEDTKPTVKIEKSRKRKRPSVKRQRRKQSTQRKRVGESKKSDGTARKLLKDEDVSSAPKEMTGMSGDAIMETDYEGQIENAKPVDREASKTQAMSGETEGKAILAKAEKQVLPQEMLMESDQVELPLDDVNDLKMAIFEKPGASSDPNEAAIRNERMRISNSIEGPVEASFSERMARFTSIPREDEMIEDAFYARKNENLRARQDSMVSRAATESASKKDGNVAGSAKNEKKIGMLPAEQNEIVMSDARISMQVEGNEQQGFGKSMQAPTPGETDASALPFAFGGGLPEMSKEERKTDATKGEGGMGK